MQQITTVPGAADQTLVTEQAATNGGYNSYGDNDPYLDGEPSFDIRAIISTIRANLVVISIIVAATLVLAVIVTMLQTPRYTAETTLQINDQSAQC